MTTYAEKLRDPRWQKRRLEVFNREKFTCESCGDKESTLCVHHDIYIKGLEPWEYDDVCLRCFCESCHQWTEALKKVVSVMLKIGVRHVQHT